MDSEGRQHLVRRFSSLPIFSRYLPRRPTITIGDLEQDLEQGFSSDRVGPTINTGIFARLYELNAFLLHCVRWMRMGNVVRWMRIGNVVRWMFGHLDPRGRRLVNYRHGIQWLLYLGFIPFQIAILLGLYYQRFTEMEVMFSIMGLQFCLLTYSDERFELYPIRVGIFCHVLILALGISCFFWGLGRLFRLLM